MSKILNSNDVISAILTQIRNAILNNRETVHLPNIKITLELLNVLVNNNYIYSYEVTEDNLVNVTIPNKYGKSTISELKRVSKPGLRVYISARNLGKIRSKGVGVLSTSKGIMTHVQAKQSNIGGEYLCHIS